MAAQLVLGGFPDELAADNAPVALKSPLVRDAGSPQLGERQSGAGPLIVRRGGRS